MTCSNRREQPKKWAVADANGFGRSRISGGCAPAPYLRNISFISLVIMITRRTFKRAGVWTSDGA
eukprot:3846804-Amphidinium_carterae.2